MTEAIKKHFLRALKIALFAAGVVLMYKAADFAFSDDTASESRITMHDFYEMEKVDTLFLGPSHTVYAVSTVQLTEELGEEVFSLATKSQEFPASYYLLEEALNAGKGIKHVYFEVSVSRLEKTDANETATYVVSDYMRNQFSRAKLLTELFDSTKYVQAFLRVRRNYEPSSSISVSALRNTVKAKLSPEYRNYAAPDYYLGRGQWERAGSIMTDGTAAINVDSIYLTDFPAESVQQKQLDYLQKIIDLCRSKGVDISFYLVPFSDYYYINFKDFNAVNAYVYDLAERNGVELIDLNLVKDEYLHLDMSDFVNLDHVSTSSGEKLTAFIARYIKNPSQEYFCTPEEKFPYTENIMYAGYSLKYYDAAGSETDNMVNVPDYETADISAVSWIDIPVDARLYVLEKNANGEYEPSVQLEGVKLDELTTRFRLLSTEADMMYRIQLLEPGTETVLYTTDTMFEMT